VNAWVIPLPLARRSFGQKRLTQCTQTAAQIILKKLRGYKYNIKKSI